MNFVQALDIFGIPAKEIPCLTGKGAPTEKTAAAVGCLYMDEGTGEMYKCTAAFGDRFTWQPANNGSGIHIGTEEPTNENVDVWIDTDEEADEPAGGGGSGGSGVDVTAAVGQTIRVKAVDDNGKPTAWEAVDYQPRTHWVEKKLATILPQADYVAGHSNGGGWIENYNHPENAALDEMGLFVVGEKYLVNFNGVEYECVGTEYYSARDDINYVGIGNPRCDYGYHGLHEHEDNGLPFWATYAYWEDEGTYYGFIGVEGVPVASYASFNIGISKVDETVHKLPEKFLPDSINGGGSELPIVVVTMKSFDEATGAITMSHTSNEVWDAMAAGSIAFMQVDGMLLIPAGGGSEDGEGNLSVPFVAVLDPSVSVMLDSNGLLAMLEE